MGASGRSPKGVSSEAVRSHKPTVARVSSGRLLPVTIRKKLTIEARDLTLCRAFFATWENGSRNAEG